MAIAKKLPVLENGKTEGIEIAFTDGRSVKVEFESLSPAIMEKLAAHGLAQKLGDSYSGVKGNIDEAYAECSSVADALLQGEWNRRGEGVGTILAEAIANLTGKKLAEVIAKLSEKSKEERDEIAKDVRVKAEVARIRAERLTARAAEVDTPLAI